MKIQNLIKIMYYLIKLFSGILVAFLCTFNVLNQPHVKIQHENRYKTCSLLSVPAIFHSELPHQFLIWGVC